MAKKKRRTVLWVEIELEGDGFPTAEELTARNAIMQLVQEREIGRLGGSGGGLGAMDFEVEATSVRSARGTISRLIRRIMPKRRFTIRQMKDD